MATPDALEMTTGGEAVLGLTRLVLLNSVFVSSRELLEALLRLTCDCRRVGVGLSTLSFAGFVDFLRSNSHK